MTKWFRTYWFEGLVFVAVLGVLLNDASPQMTWIDTNSDGVHLTFAAKFLYAAHKTSAPLYLLLGHLFQYIPFGTEFWRMALISVLGTFLGSIFIYLIIREHLKGQKRNRLYAVLGVIIFVGSALVMSQSVIVKYYSLTSMFGLMAYYFLLKGKNKSCVVALGAGMATHGIILFTAIPIFIFNRKLWKWSSLAILAGFSLFYLYAPLVGKFNPPPFNMWGNLTPQSQIIDVYSTMMMLSGGLAIYDLPKRIFDTIGLLGVSLGLALIVITIYFAKMKEWWRNLLFWLFVMPILYFLGNFAPQTYVYLFPAIAYGAIITTIQLAKMKKYWVVAIAIIAVGLFAFNAWYFDIGKNLDPNLSATKFYKEELPKIPDGEILMPTYGWQWAMIFSYNQNEGKNIIPVCLDTVVSTNYQETLKQYGVKFKDVGVAGFGNILEKQNELATSIVKMNDNVWTTIQSDPETYGAKIVKTNGDESLVLKIATEAPGQIHWKPDAPYGIITGSIEVTNWNYLTLSNYNVMFFAGLASIGMILNWLYWSSLSGVHKRKGKEVKNVG